MDRIESVDSPSLACAVAAKRSHARSVLEQQPLAILPGRLAFFDEGGNALLGIARHHVFHHHFGRVLVGIRDAHFQLAVERLLAELHHRCRLGGDLARKFERLLTGRAGLDHTVDEADAIGVLGRDHVSGEQHLECMLARQVARERDHGRRAEQADVHARRAQAERGSAHAYEKRIAAGFPDRVTPELAAVIAELDTAFLATVSAGGAPYIQHRGGPKGFIKVLDEKTLAFADYAGNRQYITLSNLAENDRAYLFLLDFARRRRIKLWGRARMVEDDPALLARLVDRGYRGRPERAILFTVEAWDVNCSQHITARFTEAEIEEATAALRDRIAALEAENARLRAGASLAAPLEDANAHRARA